MACAVSVPFEKNGPRDGPRLCTFQLIHLAVIALYFLHFPLLAILTSACGGPLDLTSSIILKCKGMDNEELE